MGNKWRPCTWIETRRISSPQADMMIGNEQLQEVCPEMCTKWNYAAIKTDNCLDSRDKDSGVVERHDYNTDELFGILEVRLNYLLFLFKAGLTLQNNVFFIES